MPRRSDSTLTVAANHNAFAWMGVSLRSNANVVRAALERDGTLLGSASAEMNPTVSVATSLRSRLAMSTEHARRVNSRRGRVSTRRR